MDVTDEISEFVDGWDVNETPRIYSEDMKMGIDARAAFCEFVIMTLFLYISLGTAILSNSLLMTSLVFGLSVTMFIYASHHTRAGQLNPAVSIPLAVAGYITPSQAFFNSFAQLAGSVLASGLLKVTIPDAFEQNLAANEIQDGFNVGQAFLAEIICTFALQFIVFEAMLHPRSKAGKMGPLAVGLVVFAVHGILTPIDKCSLNPARWFGPALLTNTWDDSWVFVMGPIIGGLVGIPAHIAFLTEWKRTSKRPIASQSGELV